MSKEALTPYSELDATLKYIFWYDQPMAKRNYLVEGISGTGKVQYVDELQRRGYEAINGDRELAYQGDPERKTNRSLWS